MKRAAIFAALLVAACGGSSSGNNGAGGAGGGGPGGAAGSAGPSGSAGVGGTAVDAGAFDGPRDGAIPDLAAPDLAGVQVRTDGVAAGRCFPDCIETIMAACPRTDTCVQQGADSLSVVCYSTGMRVLVTNDGGVTNKYLTGIDGTTFCAHHVVGATEVVYVGQNSAEFARRILHGSGTEVALCGGQVYQYSTNTDPCKALQQTRTCTTGACAWTAAWP